MDDLDFCDAFVQARRVCQDAILPLLFRATAAKGSKIRWKKSIGIEEGMADGNGLYSVMATADAPEDLPRPAFRITATVLVRENGRELEHSVLCEHLNARSGLVKLEVLCKSEPYISGTSTFNLRDIRGWYQNEFSQCVAKAEERLAARGF